MFGLLSKLVAALLKGAFVDLDPALPTGRERKTSTRASISCRGRRSGKHRPRDEAGI